MKRKTKQDQTMKMLRKFRRAIVKKARHEEDQFLEVAAQGGTNARRMKPFYRYQAILECIDQLDEIFSPNAFTRRDL